MSEPSTYTEVIWDIMKEVEYDDPNFEFSAGLLSYGLANNGYTQKQLKYVKKFHDKYSYIWDDGEPRLSNERIENATIN